MAGRRYRNKGSNVSSSTRADDTIKRYDRCRQGSKRAAYSRSPYWMLCSAPCSPSSLRRLTTEDWSEASGYRKEETQTREAEEGKGSRRLERYTQDHNQ